MKGFYIYIIVMAVVMCGYLENSYTSSFFPFFTISSLSVTIIVMKFPQITNQIYNKKIRLAIIIEISWLNQICAMKKIKNERTAPHRKLKIILWILLL